MTPPISVRPVFSRAIELASDAERRAYDDAGSFLKERRFW